MKKIFVVCALIFIFIISSTICYAAMEGFDTIKLGLFFGNSAKTSVNIGSFYGLDVGYESASGFVPTISIEQSDIKVFINSEGKMEIEGISVIDGDMVIKPKEGFIWIEGIKYRGFCILLLNGGKMTVINKVGTEEYEIVVASADNPQPTKVYPFLTGIVFLSLRVSPFTFIWDITSEPPLVLYETSYMLIDVILLQTAYKVTEVFTV